MTVLTLHRIAGMTQHKTGHIISLDVVLNHAAMLFIIATHECMINVACTRMDCIDQIQSLYRNSIIFPQRFALLNGLSNSSY